MLKLKWLMAETMRVVIAVVEKRAIEPSSRENVLKTASKKFLSLNGILQCGPYFPLLSAVHCLRKRNKMGGEKRSQIRKRKMKADETKN